MRLFRFFHLPFLFWLPLYYAWQTSGVIQQANNSYSEYWQWLGELQSTTELPTLHTTDTEAHSENVDSESTPSSLPPVPCFQSKSMPELLLKVRTTWNTFVDSRLDEWKIAITFAGVLVAYVLPELIYTNLPYIFHVKRIPYDLSDPPSDRRPIYACLRVYSCLSKLFWPYLWTNIFVVLSERGCSIRAFCLSMVAGMYEKDLYL